MSQVASRPKPKPKKRRVEADGSYEEPVKSSKAKGKEREVPFGRTREVIPAPEYGPEKWDENADGIFLPLGSPFTDNLPLSPSFRTAASLRASNLGHSKASGSDNVGKSCFNSD